MIRATPPKNEEELRMRNEEKIDTLLEIIEFYEGALTSTRKAICEGNQDAALSRCEYGLMEGSLQVFNYQRDIAKEEER